MNDALRPIAIGQAQGDILSIKIITRNKKLAILKLSTSNLIAKLNQFIKHLSTFFVFLFRLNINSFII